MEFHCNRTLKRRFVKISNDRMKILGWGSLEKEWREHISPLKKIRAKKSFWRRHYHQMARHLIDKAVHLMLSDVYDGDAIIRARSVVFADAVVATDHGSVPGVYI
jgi:hypothetical protein